MTTTLLTWNILADCTKHHFKNPNDTLLSRETRTPLIITLLLSENSDIYINFSRKKVYF